MQNNEIKKYQIDAVNAIVDFYRKGGKKGKVYLPVGMGKTDIIVKTISQIIACNEDEKILIITFNLELRKQFIMRLREYQINYDNALYHEEERMYGNVSVVTCQRLIGSQEEINNYSIIICDQMHAMKESRYEFIFSNASCCYIGFFVSKYELQSWFYDAEVIFSYEIKSILNVQSEEYIANFLIPLLLSENGYKNIKNDFRIGRIRADEFKR